LVLAALLKMAQGERTLIVPPDAPMRPKREFRDRPEGGFVPPRAQAAHQMASLVLHYFRYKLDISK
jgi:hypothetical protein